MPFGKRVPHSLPSIRTAMGILIPKAGECFSLMLPPSARLLAKIASLEREYLRLTCGNMLRTREEQHADDQNENERILLFSYYVNSFRKIAHPPPPPRNVTALLLFPVHLSSSTARLPCPQCFAQRCRRAPSPLRPQPSAFPPLTPSRCERTECPCPFSRASALAATSSRSPHSIA